MPPPWSCCLFDRAEDARPSRVLTLERTANRSYHYWHVLVPDVRPGQLYGWRARGPFDPARGLRFDGQKLLLDPYGRAVAVPASYDRRAACRPGDNAGAAMKSVVADLSALRLGGGRSAPAPLLAQRHLRAARARLHAPPELRRDRVEARHLRRPGGEDPAPPRRWASRRWSCMPVFQFDPQDAPPGLLELLGLLSGLLLRAARGLRRRREARWAPSTSSATW